MDILVEKLLDKDNLTIPGFFVSSTAPQNVEEDVYYDIKDETQPTLRDVVECLYQQALSDNQNPGLVIAIHGYNSGVGADGVDSVREYWYKPLCEHINADPLLQKKLNNQLFIGYRWSSERVAGKNLFTALKALPIVLAGLFYGGLLTTLICLILAIWLRSWLLSLPLVLGTLLFSLVLSLVVLRVIVYFRDSYRATYFGVPDLVELIRKLDQGLMERRVRETLSDTALYDRIASKTPEMQDLERSLALQAMKKIQIELSKDSDLAIDRTDAKFQRFLRKLRQLNIFPELNDETLTNVIERLVLIQALAYDDAQRYWKQHSIKLSFIGHSMGSHVTTQVLRVLADVFDPRSIGSLNEGAEKVEKLPSSRIGRVFCLGRLVLVAPDIPLLTITSGRANFLRSSLRRFEEAYLFSNEGDLALRLASTAANYFSFPARSRTQGHRLGNVTVRSPGRSKALKKQTLDQYGIANLNQLSSPQPDHLLKYLEVNVLNKNENQSLDPSSQKPQTDESVASIKEDKESIADLFTYFDCTEYYDVADYNSVAQKQPFNVLIGEGQKSPLNLIEYINLFFAFSTFSSENFPKCKDVHSGYFAGRFSKLLIYRLAFMGFQELLDSLIGESPSTFGISALPPQDLEEDLSKARQLPATAQEKRKIALRYFSWICAQKRLQVLVSPERYQVNVLGRDRDDTRESILMQELHE